MQITGNNLTLVLHIDCCAKGFGARASAGIEHTHTLFGIQYVDTKLGCFVLHEEQSVRKAVQLGDGEFVAYANADLALLCGERVNSLLLDFLYQFLARDAQGVGAQGQVGLLAKGSKQFFGSFKTEVLMNVLQSSVQKEYLTDK